MPEMLARELSGDAAAEFPAVRYASAVNPNAEIAGLSLCNSDVPADAVQMNVVDSALHTGFVVASLAHA